MATDIFSTITDLSQERFKTGIIHASPDLGNVMSQFCKKICNHNHGKYLDILEFFINNPSISEVVDTFNPDRLKNLLIQESKGQTLLLVDRADFLLDTWHRSERQDFFRLITNQWDGYKSGMGAVLIFALQTSHEIEAQRITDSHGQTRVFRLIDFYDIR